MDEFPGITCRCATYGREILNEAVKSFLMQDYLGPLELLILNDNPYVKIKCDYPGVRVINLLNSFDSLGEKFNALIEEAKYDILVQWDDDDIQLPWSVSVQYGLLLESGKFENSSINGFFEIETDGSFRWSAGQLPSPRIMTKNIWRKAGKYPEIKELGKAIDAAFNLRISNVFNEKRRTPAIHGDFYVWRKFSKDPYVNSGDFTVSPYWAENYFLKFFNQKNLT